MDNKNLNVIDVDFEVVEVDKKLIKAKNNTFNLFKTIEILQFNELNQLYSWLLFCDKKDSKSLIKKYLEKDVNMDKKELITKIIKQSIILLNKTTGWYDERLYIDNNYRLCIKNTPLLNREEKSICDENIKYLCNEDIEEISNRIIELSFLNLIGEDKKVSSSYKKCEIIYNLDRNIASNIIEKNINNDKTYVFNDAIEKVKNKAEELSENTIQTTKNISEKINILQKIPKNWKNPLKKSIDKFIDTPTVNKTAKKIAPYVAGVALVEKGGIAPYLALSKVLGGANILAKAIIGKGLPFVTWTVGAQALKCSLPAIIPLGIYYYMNTKKDTILERIVYLGFGQLIVLGFAANQCLKRQEIKEEREKIELEIRKLQESIKNEKEKSEKLKKELKLEESKLKEKELKNIEELSKKYEEFVKFYENLALEQDIIETINSAQNTIVISVPWLSPYLFGKPKGIYPEINKEFKMKSQIVRALSKASKRGVNIKIYTGFGDFLDDRNDLDKRFLNTVILAKGLISDYWYTKDFKNVQIEIINSHDKVLIVDNKIIYSGSFNFLSKTFQYDTKVENKTERMVKLELPNKAKERFEALENEEKRTNQVFKNLPKVLKDYE